MLCLPTCFLEVLHILAHLLCTNSRLGPAGPDPNSIPFELGASLAHIGLTDSVRLILGRPLSLGCVGCRLQHSVRIDLPAGTLKAVKLLRLCLQANKIRQQWGMLPLKLSSGLDLLPRGRYAMTNSMECERNEETSADKFYSNSLRSFTWKHALTNVQKRRTVPEDLSDTSKKPRSANRRAQAL